jgi:hypothetical protein
MNELINNFIENEKNDTSLFFGNENETFSNNLTNDEINKVIIYILTKFCNKKPISESEIKILISDFKIILKRLQECDANLSKYLIGYVLFIMNKLYNLNEVDISGRIFFCYSNIAFSFIVCYLIAQKYLSDHNYSLKEFAIIFNFKNSYFVNNEFRILYLLDFKLYCIKEEIENILRVVFSNNDCN